MHILHHPAFLTSDYAHDPAAAAGRMEAILEALEPVEGLEWVTTPGPASGKQLRLVHTMPHLASVEREGSQLHDMARLAAGASIQAAELACEGKPALALVRPPGHHASPDSCWGFCYLNNMGIAIQQLLTQQTIRSAYILDFDLHTGDGNINSIGHLPGITIHNPRTQVREDYLVEVESELATAESHDIIGVSAGFDAHVKDWGGILTTEDYRTMGGMVKQYSEKWCEGRRFALLEGGYNHEVLGRNVAAFVEGFR